MINQFNILDFGAAAGAENAQTAAIQAAIDAADAAKGTVVIPAGIFKTGSLNLKGAGLYLEKGAVLLGSERREDYTFNGYVHCEFGETFSLLYSLNHQDITISGEGTIDLNGKSFFDFSTYNLPEELAERFNDEQKEESTALFAWRPNQPIFFYGCTHVTVRDITILDASSWTLTFAECDRVLVDGITNIGHPRVPNNDGIHITASRNVIISNCNITSADDCIAISSITREIAARIFAIAEKSSTPCFSASALRFAQEYEQIKPEEVDGIVSEGPGPLEQYSIHQLEPIIALMGPKASRVLYTGTAAHPAGVIEFEDGRRAFISHHDWDCPFAVTIDKKSGGTFRTEIQSDYFVAFMREMADFFLNGTPKVSHEDTIAVIAVREALVRAAGQPGTWVSVYA